MNNLSKLFSTAVLGLTIAFGATGASAAACSVSDVTNNPGANVANACVNRSGNDKQMNYENLINGDFGLNLNWSYIDDDNFGGSSSGSWDFTAFTMSNPFVIVLKAGNNFASYLFNQTSNGTGDWITTGIPTNGNNLIDISHISLYTTDSVSEVPVPAALWLFAPALLGMMGFRRRNNKA